MVGAPQGQLSLMGRNYIFSPSWHPSNYGVRIKIMYGDGSSKRTSSSLAPYLFPLDSLKLNLNYQSLKVAVKALFLLSHTRSIVLMIREYFLAARQRRMNLDIWIIHIISKHMNFFFPKKGSYLGGLIFEGTYNRRDLYVSNLVGLYPGYWYKFH